VTAKSAEQLREEAAQIEQFQKRLNKGKPGFIRRLDDKSGVAGVEAIPTGAISLDLALGVGGLPRGRVVELYGPESSGKTSLALSVASSAQKRGGQVLFVDAENAISMQHVTDMGCDPSQFYLIQPDSGEEGLRAVQDALEVAPFDVIVVDSVAALVPQAELDGEIGDSHVALLARLMSQALRMLSKKAQSAGAVVIFINQLREKPGQSYGNPEVTPGGRALKFYSSVRLEVRSAAGDRIKTGDRVIGQKCRVTVKKNKVGPPFQTAEYQLFFGKGVARGLALTKVATEMGLLHKAGAFFYDAEDRDSYLAQGEDNMAALFDEDAELAAEFERRVYTQLRGDMPEEPLLDDIDEDGVYADA